jgi:hypothetical protein
MHHNLYISALLRLFPLYAFTFYIHNTYIINVLCVSIISVIAFYFCKKQVVDSTVYLTKNNSCFDTRVGTKSVGYVL